MRLCPWSLASSIPVLGLERVCPRKGCPWPRIFFVSLASSLVSSTPPLVIICLKIPFYPYQLTFGHDELFFLFSFLNLVCSSSKQQHIEQRWSRGHKARGQGRGHKKSEAKAKTAFPGTDTLEAKDRNARGQGPRIQAQVLSKKKRSTKIFQAISKKFFKRSTKLYQFKK